MTRRGKPPADAPPVVTPEAATPEPRPEAVAMEQAAPQREEGRGFPRPITLRNHGGFAVTEPATGAYVAPGATFHATVHDRAQALRVLQNARFISERNGGRQRLAVAGLDDVVGDEPGDAT